MNKTIAIAALAILIAPAAAAMAQPPSAPPPPPHVFVARPYGDAGCGLGSVVFGPTPGFSQVFAATTNTLFVSQTFGITSGTSNCVDIAVGVVGVRSFSTTNRAVLSKDIARGRGETIATLSTLGGCNSPAAVGASLQKNFRRIVPSAEVSDSAFGQNVAQVMASDSSLGCKKLVSVAAAR